MRRLRDSLITLRYWKFENRHLVLKVVIEPKASPVNFQDEVDIFVELFIRDLLVEFCSYSVHQSGLPAHWLQKVFRRRQYIFLVKILFLVDKFPSDLLLDGFLRRLKYLIAFISLRCMDVSSCSEKVETTSFQRIANSLMTPATGLDNLDNLIQKICNEG